MTAVSTGPVENVPLNRAFFVFEFGMVMKTRLAEDGQAAAPVLLRGGSVRLLSGVGLGAMSERLFYRKRHRVRTSEEFGAVFDFKARKSRGAMTVFVMPNGLSEHRLGLSVGRRVGNAVVRGKVKRMIREAFRHERSSIPMCSDGGGFDLVVTVRGHEMVGLDVWREWFVGAVGAAIRVVEKRADEEGVE
tara:strand:- start:431222 stop:431791 length:570 start_codon:yes stop_codon:yes gene_type:complete